MKALLKKWGDDSDSNAAGKAAEVLAVQPAGIKSRKDQHHRHHHATRRDAAKSRENDAARRSAQLHAKAVLAQYSRGDEGRGARTSRHANGKTTKPSSSS